MSASSSVSQPHSASPNRVLLALMPAALAALTLLDIASVQPNRIAPGQGLNLWAIMGPAGVLLAMLPLGVCSLAWRATTLRLRWALCLVVLAMIALPLGLAAFCRVFIDPGAPYARVGLAAGFWVLLFVFMLALIEFKASLRLPHGSWWGLGALMLGAWGLSLASGMLDKLALMQEYLGRSDKFIEALLYHSLLVASAVGLSLLMGFALALAMRRWPRLERGINGVLSLIQTIPSLALFGLLLAPLAWLADRYEWLAALGVQGIGAAPALIALVGYSLLPMTRNTFVALGDVDKGVIESARGMGMSPSQIFLQVRLPLALPVMIEGVRITSIQAIGLAAVAALIGAGGLGTFVFQGLGQAAMDLVLLGALPIIAMAVIVDGLLTALAGALRQGVRHD
ncbi:osmoprotectant transport system permease protein [Onishia taeanensis]|uniref:Osmoprotectant transport system permease protein n=1 Tax=Onishia taeanensis TaxID=284577 RepID=A0A1G7Q1H9_9GAMM|nr:osmoprotectant transport system permease protein [Halomonas taeanensis]